MRLAAILAALLAHNLLVRDRGYVLWCWLTTAVVVVVSGASLGDVGVSTAGAGLGLACGAAVALVMVAAACLSAPGCAEKHLCGAFLHTRPLFLDRRMAGVTARGTLWRAAVRIPLGTVLLEEVAFRGVLPVLMPAPAAAVLFGLWHIVPTARTLRTNGRHASPLGLAGAVAVTTAAGIVFNVLRDHGGGVLAPAMVHAAVTSTATVASFAVHRTTLGLPRRPGNAEGRRGPPRSVRLPARGAARTGPVPHPQARRGCAPPRRRP